MSGNDEITTWLDGIGLAQYSTVFAENAIDLDILPDVTEADLERLGVALGDRKRILRAIAALSGRSSAPAASAPLPQSEAQRRQLTVLFCDLVGSTALAVKLDPEDLRDVIRRFQGSCAAVVTQMGGHVARFMGDGLLVYFGYPQAHEDDAERAVRAGLDLVAKVGQLLLPTGDLLQVRVGIATGLVVVGDTVGEESAQEQVVVGETPNLAARLQSVAVPNTTVVAASTLRLLGDVFVCEQLGPFELKGFSEPVMAWRVLGERVVESRFAAIRSQTLTRFVGRQNELHQLYGLWNRAKGGKGQVALLCGEAGIGKFDEQVLGFVDCSAPRRLQQASLDPKHLGNGPAFTGLVRNRESFVDDLQRGIAAAYLSVSLGFEREEDWQPQARAGLPPRR